MAARHGCCVAGHGRVFARAWGGEIGTAYRSARPSRSRLLRSSRPASSCATAPGRMPREAALEPEDHPTDWAHSTAKALLAIVLSGAASIGLGLTFALYMPMAVHDRIVIGGVLVPVLWGAGMAWTLSDAKLVRAAAVLLLVITAVCYGRGLLAQGG